MRMLGLIASVVLAAAPVAAQQIKVTGHLTNKSPAHAFTFDAVEVDVLVIEEETFRPSQSAIVNHKVPKAEAPDFEYTARFTEDQAKNNYLLVVAGVTGYVPVRPDNTIGPSIRKVSSDTVGNDGTLDMPIALQKTSDLAALYRKETNTILRAGTLGADQYERAAGSAASAVELDPRIDNYLLAVKVTGQALRKGEVFPGMITSADDLSAMGDFSALSQKEQWRIETELMDSLMSAQDMELRVTRADSAAALAIRLGEDMIASLDFSDPAQSALSVTRVFTNLSLLHSEAQDCQSVIDNNARGLAAAEQLNSNWASQRVLYLDWGTCLEAMSGKGQGNRSLDQFIADTAQNDFLRSQWASFAQTAAKASDRLAFATGGPDKRVKDLGELARSIANHQE